MKILAISHMFLTPFDLLNISVYKQMKAISERGHEVKVICPLPFVFPPLNLFKKRWKDYLAVPAKMNWYGIETHYPRYLVFPKALLLASSGRRMYYGLSNVANTMCSYSHFDLIHAHMALPDGYAAMLLSQKHSIPFIVTFQATDLDITANRSRRCLQALREVFESAHRVISPSPRLTKLFLSLFGKEPITIGYGIDPREIYTSISNLSLKYQGRRIILSVSRLLKSKGIDLNIYALQQLVRHYNDLLYIIVGDGPEREPLKQLVRESRLEKNVEFVGMVPHEKAMEYMSICDIFSLPSWQETFGLAYVEAMAHGKPVIAVRGQGVDGIVTHGTTGILVKPRDIDSLVEGLDFLLTHDSERQAIGERGRKLVLENYTWANIAAKLEVVYREVLEEKEHKHRKLGGYL